MNHSLLSPLAVVCALSALYFSSNKTPHPQTQDAVAIEDEGCVSQKEPEHTPEETLFSDAELDAWDDEEDLSFDSAFERCYEDSL